MSNSGNEVRFVELRAEQRRQLIDLRQLYEALQLAEKEARRNYSGSMRWLTRKGKDYLHRKIGARERSLGPRNAQTEALYEAFRSGRSSNRGLLKQMRSRQRQMAPVNRALDLGRVPRLTARILRRLDRESLLGNRLLIVGTNALFAYESRAGVHFSSELLATGDTDLLLDLRQGVRFLSKAVRAEGLLGLLQRVDHSFRLRSPRDYRAFNSNGFFVDLIRPEDELRLYQGGASTLGPQAEDLHGAPISGLQWLINAPRFSVVSVGEDGLPVRLVSIDPRAFALHKLWVAKQSSRDPLKSARDRLQAEAVTELCQRYLQLRFDDPRLEALPQALRHLDES